MVQSSVARSACGRLFAIAAVLMLVCPNALLAQDGNGGSLPPTQPPPAAAPTRSTALFEEPSLVIGAIDFATSRIGERTGAPKNGFYPELSNMVTGSGWISLGPGYRRYFSNDRAFFDTSGALSWHLYKMAQARVEFQQLAGGHLTLGAQGMWQDDTQVNYFGIGSDVTGDDQSLYRFQTHEIVGYAKYDAADWLAITGELGWLGRPKVMDAGGTFKRDLPDAQVAFPDDPAMNLATQPAFLRSEAAITADTRDHRSYPTRGFVYRAALTGYNDRSAGTFSFREYQAEGLQLIPMAGSRWILALHGWTVLTSVPAGNAIPFYLLPAVGGHSTLRGYHNFQFHDENLVVVNAESRVRLTEHVDAAAFADAGNVARRFADLNFDKTSYGVGLRLHTATTTLARFDVAHGGEGWRFVFRTNEPFRLARIRRQVALMPFMP